MCMINNYISMMWYHKRFPFFMIHTLWTINIIIFTSKFEENSSISLSTPWFIHLIITYVLMFRLPSGLPWKKFSPLCVLNLFMSTILLFIIMKFYFESLRVFSLYLGCILQPFYLLKILPKYIIHYFYLIRLCFIVYFYTQYHNKLIGHE